MVFSLIWFSSSASKQKSFTSQERCTLYLDVSKDFISLAPFLPWMKDSQLCLTPIPTGVTNPNPVITTFDIVFVFKLGLRRLRWFNRPRLNRNIWYNFVSQREFKLWSNVQIYGSICK